MNINIRVSNIELSDALRDFVNLKLGSLDRRVHPPSSAIRCTIELSRTTNHHRKGEIYSSTVELRVNEDLYRSEFISDDLYSAIDGVKDKIERALLGGSKKKRSLARRTASRFKRLLLRGK